MKYTALTNQTTCAMPNVSERVMPRCYADRDRERLLLEEHLRVAARASQDSLGRVFRRCRPTEAWARLVSHTRAMVPGETRLTLRDAIAAGAPVGSINARRAGGGDDRRCHRWDPPVGAMARPQRWAPADLIRR